MAEGPSQRTSRDSGEIATSTLAEIYAQQGLLGRALAIYRRIQARAPEDAEIAARIERLERRVAESGTELDAAPVGAPGTGIETTAPPPRERLPWDPPAADSETPPQPETATPETAALDPATPETAAPETAAPETAAPETAAPETAAPEMTAPETTAPEVTEPEPEAAEDTAAPARVGPMDSGAFAAWLERR